jgi:hypothetical protein
MENHHFNGKTHYKWPFRKAMLVYQRVNDINHGAFVLLMGTLRVLKQVFKNDKFLNVCGVFGDHRGWGPILHEEGGGFAFHQFSDGN